MTNTAAKAREWVDRLAVHPAIPFGQILRESFAVGRITRLCNCGCNSFDIEIPEDAQVAPIAEPEPNQKGDRLVFEIVFETDLEDPEHLACLFFADPRGHLSSVDITGGWSNHVPVPEHVELRKVHYRDSKATNAL